MRSKILPVAEDREIRLAMEKVIEERRAKASGHQLYIDKLVVRMKRKSPGEPFWSAEGPQWYPPALLNLLGPILLLNIPTKWKGQLLAYYLFDYTNCKKVIGAIPESPFVLLDDVTKQMHGLLGMNKEEMMGVYKFWCADAGKPLSEREEFERTSPRKYMSADAEIKHLMSIPRPLTSEEENKLQSLSNTVRYGDFVWQCYLAKCRRFDEFKELPIPSNEDNEFILEYEQLIPVVRMLRMTRKYPFSAVERLRSRLIEDNPFLTVFSQGKGKRRFPSNKLSRLHHKHPMRFAFLHYVQGHTTKMGSLSQLFCTFLTSLSMRTSDAINVVVAV
ncbi:unnamed protein product [Cylicostephanus goldi]|uniref:Uncharacterized protein n=1 Tax=Cylicostephanus goldi TaxID=71465 RepID=A0A3P7QC83_CYLGO|nr:unnamed protein product [Cylicostephanus goldi]